MNVAAVSSLRLLCDAGLKLVAGGVLGLPFFVAHRPLVLKNSVKQVSAFFLAKS